MSFPSPRTSARPINEQPLNTGLKRLGFGGKHTAYGFKHTASTLLNEQGFNRDWIEMQLAHFQFEAHITKLNTKLTLQYVYQ